MPNQKIAKKYERIKLTLSLSETVLSIALILIIILGGYSETIRDFSYSQVENQYLRLHLHELN